MKKFKFRLERVLGLKKRAEKEARLELGRALSALAEARMRREESERACVLLEEEEARLTREGRVGTLPLQRALLDHAGRCLEEALRKEEEAAKALETAREAWREARKEARSLELLRERALRSWREEAAREEARQLDEIGRLRFLREMVPEGEVGRA